VPWLAVPNDGIENDQELAHGGDQRAHEGNVDRHLVALDI
jgi:hypothetical protein